MRQGVASSTGLATVADAVADIRVGRMVVVVDSPDRENEGDLLMAAEFATSKAINFMATHGRGLICAPLAAERLRELQVPPMVTENRDAHGTAFCVGVDSRWGTRTGISAADRAVTVRALADPDTRAADLRRPGHIFPLAGRPGGVLERAGHTEAGIDLARLAGAAPAAVICEILAPDGSMARLPELLEFAGRHGLKVLAISDLIAYRRRREKLIERAAEVRLPVATASPEFRAVGYRDLIDGGEHLALVLGDVENHPAPLVRVHAQCVAGDVFGSRLCGCAAQLRRSQEMIVAEGCGAIVYLRGHESRGSGLVERLLTLAEGEPEAPTDAPPPRRDYGIGMQVLVDLGIERMRLLTNDSSHRAGIEGFGLEVVETIPLDPAPAEPALDGAELDDLYGEALR